MKEGGGAVQEMKEGGMVPDADAQRGLCQNP